MSDKSKQRSISSFFGLPISSGDSKGKVSKGPKTSSKQIQLHLDLGQVKPLAC